MKILAGTVVPIIVMLAVLAGCATNCTWGLTTLIIPKLRLCHRKLTVSVNASTKCQVTRCHMVLPILWRATK
jgi:hypothetical protein